MLWHAKSQPTSKLTTFAAPSLLRGFGLSPLEIEGFAPSPVLPDPIDALSLIDLVPVWLWIPGAKFGM